MGALSVPAQSVSALMVSHGSRARMQSSTAMRFRLVPGELPRPAEWTNKTGKNGIPMLVFDWNEPNKDECFELQLQRLKALVADMEAVQQRRMQQALPEVAPILEQWALTCRPAPCLTGLSTGHPRLVGKDRSIITSDLQLVSSDQTWARTTSRWYRLGAPRRMEKTLRSLN
ncbi:DUF6634 family protein [Nitratireductor aquimarinus]|uniref:DUF6634 family protein n=1 Tax=Nitratireductor aquimarinus TaxID=889300 RepID=UPI00374EFF43